MLLPKVIHFLIHWFDKNDNDQSSCMYHMAAWDTLLQVFKRIVQSDKIIIDFIRSQTVKETMSLIRIL